MPPQIRRHSCQPHRTMFSWLHSSWRNMISLNVLCTWAGQGTEEPAVEHQNPLPVPQRPSFPTAECVPQDAHLGVRGILEGVEDFLQGHHIPRPLVQSPPNDAIGLRSTCARRNDAAIRPRDPLRRRNANDRGLANKRVGGALGSPLTPLPSFCWISYFLRMWASIASVIVARHRPRRLGACCQLTQVYSVRSRGLPVRRMAPEWSNTFPAAALEISSGRRPAPRFLFSRPQFRSWPAC